MYIKKINNFLKDYANYNKQEFLDILKISNTKKFDIFKLEKDFLLTLILIKFWEKYKDLIFKWWTCLNKIYFPYFRLSEDLDFVINSNLWQTLRKKLLKEYENNFKQDLEILGMKLKEERSKFDSYKLAMFTFEYKSVIDNSYQTIKIDISLKNNLYLSSTFLEIKSIYIDTIMEENIFSQHFINCIDLQESVAEKIRASLTRKVPAIRDFFDIWYIKNNSNFDFKNEKFKNLVISKLTEVNFEYTLEKNYTFLQNQIKTDLEPVLNENTHFDFDEIYNFILEFKQI